MTTTNTRRPASGTETEPVQLAHPMDVDPFAGIDEGHGYVPGDVIHDMHADAEPTFPPADPEPSISLATFQQRVQAGEWNAASTAETVDALTEPLTATELDTLLDAVNDVPTFAPSPRHRVPAAVVARRRAKNRAARRTRRTNRGN